MCVCAMNIHIMTHDMYERLKTKVQLEEVSSYLQVIRLGSKYPYSLSHLPIKLNRKIKLT